MKGEAKDRAKFLEELASEEDPEDFLEYHRKLSELFVSEFDKEREKINDEAVAVKFRLLPIKCLENYSNLYQDVIFLMA